MTHNDEFIGKLETYLDEYAGITPLPDAIRDAIRAQIPTTKQIGPLAGLMKDLTMNIHLPATARYAIVAAAVVAAAVLGYALFGREPNTGEPQPTATPLAFADAGATLLPGVYAITDIDSVEVTFTVPDGWERTLEAPEFLGPLSAGTSLSFWTVPNVFANPCQLADGMADPPIGGTVDDLASALANAPGITASDPTAVTLSGFTGRHVELTTPETACEQYAPWPSTGDPQGSNLVLPPGTRLNVWVVDVSGVRLAVMTHAHPDTSEQALTELQQIVDSISIRAR